jgi:hypothetical protein
LRSFRRAEHTTANRSQSNFGCFFQHLSGDRPSPNTCTHFVGALVSFSLLHRYTYPMNVSCCVPFVARSTAQ